MCIFSALQQLVNVLHCNLSPLPFYFLIVLHFALDDEGDNAELATRAILAISPF